MVHIFSLRNLLSIFLICFSFLNIGAQTTVTIPSSGAGSGMDYNYPFQSYFKYGWSSQLYYQSEIGSAGSITSMGFNIYNGTFNPTTIKNQNIYIRHTSATGYSSASYPGTSGFTLVYSGTITISGTSGWNTINLTTPFAYNGTSNIEILIESRHGTTVLADNHSLNVGGTKTSSTSNRSMFDYSDASFPTTANVPTKKAYFPNLKLTKCTNIGGTASASAPTVCLGGSSTFSITGQTSGQPIQWQSSTDNTIFTDISGATSSSYNATNVSATKYYRAAVGVGSCIVYSSSTLVTVNSVPSPPTAGNNGPVCTGSTLSLTASTVIGATYAWTGPYGFTSTLQNPTVNANATTAMGGSYSVTATINGCVSSTGTTNVTVSDPVSSVNLDGTQAICVNGTTSFTPSTAGGIWTSSTPSVATVSTSGVVTGVTAGTSDITYTITGTGGCNNVSATRTVTVSTPPNAGTLSGIQEICVDGNTTFSSTVTGGTWSSATQTVATVSTAGVISGLITGTSDITYTITGTGGCSNAVSTRTITVNSIPTAPSAGNNSPVCVGSSLSLTASSIVGATYLWTGPNGFSSTAQNPTVSTSVASIMAGTYSVTVTSNGCMSTTVGTTNVTINSVPSAPTVIPTISVCEGNTLTLGMSSVVNASYSWTGPNSFINATQNPVVSANATNVLSGNYLATVTVGGCTSPSSTVVVTVNPNPIANVGTSGTITLGQNKTLGASSVSGNTYSWVSSPVGFTSILSNPVVSPTYTTTYTLTETNTSGCTKTNSVIVTVNVPPLTVTGTISNVYCSVDNSGVIDVTATGGVPPYTYEWSSGQLTSDISGLPEGTYSITVKDASIPVNQVTKNFTIGVSPEWQYIKGISSTSGKLTKTASTGNENSWASSSNSFAGEGWVSYKITSKSTKYMIGFSKAHHKEGNHDLGTPIDYGIEQDYSQENLYKANTALIYTSYQVGDVIKIAREGGNIKYYKNGNLLSAFTDVVSPTDILYLEATMSDQNSMIEDLTVNFCSATVSQSKGVNSYAKPVRKLDGGFCETEKGILRFQFEEEYAVPLNKKLAYTIYNANKQKMAEVSSTGAVLGSSPTPLVNYGINTFNLDLSSTPIILAIDQFYIMEILNSKNEKVYLRFRFNHKP
jgi:hypothetical protein